MMLARRQTTHRVDKVITRHSSHFFHSETLDHFRHCGSARECWGTTVGEKACSFDAAVVNLQTQTQTIAADRIGFFGGVGRVW